MKIKTIWSVAGLAALSSVIGCSGGNDQELLATVNNDPITVGEFTNYLQIKPSVRVVANGQVAELPVSDTLAFQAMQDLVQRAIIFQLGKEQGVMPTEAEIDKEVKFQSDLNKDFIKNLQVRGLNLKQIRDEVKYSLVQERLVSKGQNVTSADVDQWLKDNPSALVNPASVSLSWIAVSSDAKKKQVDEALSAGTKFSDVALKMSEDPNVAVTGGRYQPQRGPLAIASLPDELKKPVEAGKVDDDLDWVKVGTGWAKFHIDAKTPESKRELTDAMRESLRRNLAVQRGSRATDLRKEVLDKLESADIVVRRDSLKEAWSNFASQLKSQAKQAASQPTGASAPEDTGKTDSTKTPESK